MNQPVRNVAQTRSTYTATGHIDADARRVLRNTWSLLALTLLFAAGTALLSMRMGWSHPGLLITLAGYFGLLFLTSALRNSAWGLLAVFALTGFMGLTIGPIISAYLAAFSNGHQIVVAAFATTAAAFLGLSAFAMVTRRDFSFLGSFLTAGILAGFVLALVAWFFQLPALALAVSGIFVLLMLGLILYETQQIINGGERNYIMATVTLFVSLFNLFTSLLHLFGFAFGED
ncbi:MAG: Bax inhibitor-1/YccA family protein [Wenzhouxiangellaceae bacterium]